MSYQRYIGPAILVVAAAAVVSALGVPVLAFLPSLIFLACPLMMIFMMRGMDHGGGHADCHGARGLHDTPQRGDQPADTSATRQAR